MKKNESKTRDEDSHSQLGVWAFLVATFFGICTFWALVASLQATFSGNLFNPSQEDKAATASAGFFFIISLSGLAIGGAMAILALRQENKKRTLPTIAIGVCILVFLLVFGPAISRVVS